MRAVLEFSLPEETAEHLAAVKAGDLAAALWELDQWLRAEVKYGQDEARSAYADEVRRKLWGIVRERELSEVLP